MVSLVLCGAALVTAVLARVGPGRSGLTMICPGKQGLVRSNPHQNGCVQEQPCLDQVWLVAALVQTRCG